MPLQLRDAASNNRNVKRRLADSAAAAPCRARGLKALSQYFNAPTQSFQNIACTSAGTKYTTYVVNRVYMIVAQASAKYAR